MKALGALSFLLLASGTNGAHAETTSESAALQKYCAGCHNETLKTGGFVLDVNGLEHPESHFEDWEKVVRKLRGRSMPPVELPRPDDHTYQALLTSIETALDHAAEARPNP